MCERSIRGHSPKNNSILTIFIRQYKINKTRHIVFDAYKILKARERERKRANAIFPFRHVSTKSSVLTFDWRQPKPQPLPSISVNCEDAPYLIHMSSWARVIFCGRIAFLLFIPMTDTHVIMWANKYKILLQTHTHIRMNSVYHLLLAMVDDLSSPRNWKRNGREQLISLKTRRIRNGQRKRSGETRIWSNTLKCVGSSGECWRWSTIESSRTGRCLFATYDMTDRTDRLNFWIFYKFVRIGRMVLVLITFFVCSCPQHFHSFGRWTGSVIIISVQTLYRFFEFHSSNGNMFTYISITQSLHKICVVTMCQKGQLDLLTFEGRMTTTTATKSLRVSSLKFSPLRLQSGRRRRMP